MTIGRPARPSPQCKAALDRAKGYEDRMMGYYDSWYKTNRKDGGKAYDEGVAKAMEDPNCCESCINI